MYTKNTICLIYDTFWPYKNATRTLTKNVKKIFNENNIVKHVIIVFI